MTDRQAPRPLDANPELSAKLLKLFPEADAARISMPLDTMFLVLGYKRSTKDDPGRILDHDGKELVYDYLYETAVASGGTARKLTRNALAYKRLLGKRGVHGKRPRQQE